MKTLRAFTLVEVCVSMFVIISAASTAALCLRRCQPTVKCCANRDDVLSQREFKTWCSPVTRKTMEANGWVDLGINFADNRSCQRVCGTNSAPTFSGVLDPLRFNFVSDESLVPEGEEYVSTDIWSSFDLRTWSFFGTLVISDDGDWMETAITPTNVCQFFRVVQVYDLPAQ